MATKILVVDNYDSFVFNLVHYLQQLGAEVKVKRNDEVQVSELKEYNGILLSPGPGTPKQAGNCLNIVEEVTDSGTPLLGVCLGHQAIGEAFDGVVSQAPELLHGKTSEIIHDGRGVFGGVPQNFLATRYHSLAVNDDTCGPELEVSATTPDGTIMGLRHKTLPIEGVQFHPESILTQHGHLLLANWLTSCGVTGAVSTAKKLAQT